MYVGAWAGSRISWNLEVMVVWVAEGVGKGSGYVLVGCAEMSKGRVYRYGIVGQSDGQRLFEEECE